MKKSKKTSLLIILVIFIILILNIKNIGRVIYPNKYREFVTKYSKEYNIDPYFLSAVIKTESNYDKNAVSRKNAMGLMQLTPATAKDIAEKMEIENFHTDMLFEPEVNIKMGSWYINDLKREFGDNEELILAAYNGGRGNVKKWLKDEEKSKDGENLHYIPFKETDKYVKKVKVNRKIYKYLYNASTDN